MKVVAMCAAWRTWTAVAYLLKIVRPLMASDRDCFLSWNILWQLFHIGRNVESGPVNPGLARRVRVVRDEGETLSFFRHSVPSERRRNIRIVACVLFRNHPAFLKSFARDFQFRFFQRRRLRRRRDVVRI